MNEQALRRDVRIARSPDLDDEQPTADFDERERDMRPGRFTIRGAFLDLNDAGAGAFDADNAPA